MFDLRVGGSGFGRLLSVALALFLACLCWSIYDGEGKAMANRGIYIEFLCFIVLGIVLNTNPSQPTTHIHAGLAPTPTTIAAGTVVEDRDGVDMVFVPSGEFQMGIGRDDFIAACTNIMKAGTFEECGQLAESINLQTDIFDVHAVNVTGFWIDRDEVTIERYQKCSQAGACPAIDATDLAALTDSPRKPQIRVTWYDALIYCNLRGARLPTEEEWEYAAKGQSDSFYPWGNTFIPAYVASGNTTRVVGSIPENKSWAQVYDMSGNVAEWVENRFLPYRSNISWISGSGLEVSRVIRGGSWLNGAVQLTTFYRNFARAGQPLDDVGFRCARTSYPLDM